MKTVLFLCTGNSARSILAECLLNRLGKGRFRALSASSLPAGKVNPFALELLDSLDYDTTGLRSKNWSEFADGESREAGIDFVFTVCDSAAAEACPVWPGTPVTAHWGLPDPAAKEGSDAEKRVAFLDTYKALARRIEAFVNLPMDSLDRLALRRAAARIGKS
jgi:arsenate reductase (thioredoxin)